MDYCDHLIELMTNPKIQAPSEVPKESAAVVTESVPQRDFTTRWQTSLLYWMASLKIKILRTWFKPFMVDYELFVTNH